MRPNESQAEEKPWNAVRCTEELHTIASAIPQTHLRLSAAFGVYSTESSSKAGVDRWFAVVFPA